MKLLTIPNEGGKINGELDSKTNSLSSSIGGSIFKITCGPGVSIKDPSQGGTSENYSKEYPDPDNWWTI